MACVIRLKKMGYYVVEVPLHPKLAKPVNGHPDMMLFSDMRLSLHFSRRVALLCALPRMIAPVLSLFLFQLHLSCNWRNRERLDAKYLCRLFQFLNTFQVATIPRSALASVNHFYFVSLKDRDLNRVFVAHLKRLMRINHSRFPVRSSAYQSWVSIGRGVPCYRRLS